MSIEMQVQLARVGRELSAICRVASGWVVLAQRQYLRGYCVLLPDPVVPSLNDLSPTQRGVFLTDMALVGDALLEVTGAYRINYAILGNSDPVLHAHIVPRYLSEPEAIRQNLPWLYEQAFMQATPFDYQRDKALIEQLAGAIQKRL